MPSERPSHVYDEAVASHYAAYRPPLHQVIVSDVLAGRAYANGLDVGCGTGRSSVALGPLCGHVLGCDPSPEMIAAATPQPGISYVCGTLDAVTRPDGGFDVVSFAGVLAYLDAEATLTTLRQLCAPGAHVLVYDFRVQVEDVLACLNVGVEAGDSGYDHRRNFEAHVGVETVTQGQKGVALAATATEAAHVLLSSAERYAALQDVFGSEDLLRQVTDRLVAQGFGGEITAQTYWTLHRLIEAPSRA